MFFLAMSGGQGERVGGQNHIRPPAPNTYEDSLCQETNYSLERFFVVFSAFRVLA